MDFLKCCFLWIERIMRPLSSGGETSVLCLSHRRIITVQYYWPAEPPLYVWELGGGKDPHTLTVLTSDLTSGTWARGGEKWKCWWPVLHREILKILTVAGGRGILVFWGTHSCRIELPTPWGGREKRERGGCVPSATDSQCSDRF